jgi:2-polyprenyl-3-methyl-5-hydroxy-6-metoxy-1,4-benzoquinol methylase
MNDAFSKYKTRGAYHWDHISKLPWKHHCFTAIRYRLILEAATVKPGERLLDVGCGDGALLSLFEPLEVICIGVEPEPVGREFARELYNSKNLSIELFSNLNEVADDSQDVVICAEVIEHVRDVAGLMRDMRRVLRLGGRIIFSTPIRMSESPLDKEHVREYFPGEFLSLVSEYFQIIDHRLELPVFGLELYSWRPWFLFKLPITKYLMNIMSAWFGYSVMRHAGMRYPTLQVVLASKE